MVVHKLSLGLVPWELMPASGLHRHQTCLVCIDIWRQNTHILKQINLEGRKKKKTSKLAIVSGLLLQRCHGSNSSPHTCAAVALTGCGSGGFGLKGE